MQTRNEEHSTPASVVFYALQMLGALFVIACFLASWMKPYQLSSSDEWLANRNAEVVVTAQLVPRT